MVAYKSSCRTKLDKQKILDICEFQSSKKFSKTSKNKRTANLATL